MKTSIKQNPALLIGTIINAVLAIAGAFVIVYGLAIWAAKYL